MHVFENELEARERAVLHDKSQSSAEGQAFPKFQIGTTTSALFTKHSGPTYMYCKQSHPSYSCKMVTNHAARKDILIKQGRCFVCLRKDHLSKNCPSKHECFKCKGKHHISIFHPMATMVPIFQEQHPSKNILRNNQETIVPQEVMKVAPALAYIPQEPHPHRNTPRSVRGIQDRIS